MLGVFLRVYWLVNINTPLISDYLTILSENGIYFKLPELVISHDHEEYEWIYSSFPGTDFWLLYKYYNDGSKYSLLFQVPISYRPQYEALAYLMVSVLDIDYPEADELLHSLQYNVINHSSSIQTNDYELDYFEYATIDGFLSLAVTKHTK